MQIKPKINRLYLEASYNIETLSGIIIGIGITKIIIDSTQRNNFGIITGLIIFGLGIMFWYRNQRGQ